MTTPDDVLEAAARRRLKELDDNDDPDPGFVAGTKQRLMLLAGDMAALEWAKGAPVFFERGEGDDLRIVPADTPSPWRPIVEAPYCEQIEVCCPLSGERGFGSFNELDSALIFESMNSSINGRTLDGAIERNWLWKPPEPLPEEE